MNKQDLTTKFWLATQYYRAPSPSPEEWHEDLRNCVKIGLDLVQVRVFWRWHERQENQYDWRDLDAFMQEAKEAGCKVIFQICLENAPEYIFRKYDGYRVNIQGMRLWPTCNAAFYVGGWLPCFDNPEVMKHGLRFVEQLVRRYQADSTLAFYHAWNEPRCRPMGECACSHSIASYQRWLRRRFGTVEELNAFTGKCWGDFEQVDAARDTGDFTDMFLWRQWGAAMVQERVAKVAETIRLLDATRAVISHVGETSVCQDPLMDISDDVAMSMMTDFYGTSFPARAMPEYFASMILDWMRCACGGRFSVYELYPSIGCFLPEIPPELLQQWIWQSVAAGAKGLVYWQYKKERVGLETNDAGLVETDGSMNDTTRVVAQSNALLGSLAEELPSWSVPPSKVALGFDFQGNLASRLEFTMGREGDYALSGKFRAQVPGGYPSRGALWGTYHILWKENYQVDFIETRFWKEKLAGYRVLILPVFPIMDRERTALLTEFVQRGGCLIVGAGFARRQANTMLQIRRPGEGLCETFGFREEKCLELGGKRWPIEIPGIGRLMAEFERVEYRTDGQAEILGTWSDNGRPAILSRQVGKGKVIAVGTLLGSSGYGADSPIWNETWESMGNCFRPGETTVWQTLLTRLLKDNGVESVARWNLPGLQERLIQDGEGHALRFAFRLCDSPSPVPEEAWNALDIPGGTPVVQLSHVKAWRMNF